MATMAIKVSVTEDSRVGHPLLRQDLAAVDTVDEHKRRRSLRPLKQSDTTSTTSPDNNDAHISDTDVEDAEFVGTGPPGSPSHLQSLVSRAFSEQNQVSHTISEQSQVSRADPKAESRIAVAAPRLLLSPWLPCYSDSTDTATQVTLECNCYSSIRDELRQLKTDFAEAVRSLQQLEVYTEYLESQSSSKAVTVDMTTQTSQIPAVTVDMTTQTNHTPAVDMATQTTKIPASTVDKTTQTIPVPVTGIAFDIDATAFFGRVVTYNGKYGKIEYDLGLIHYHHDSYIGFRPLELFLPVIFYITRDAHGRLTAYNIDVSPCAQ